MSLCRERRAIDNSRCVKGYKHTGLHRNDDGVHFSNEECIARAADPDEQITPKQFAADLRSFIKKHEKYLTVEGKEKLGRVADNPPLKISKVKS